MLETLSKLNPLQLLSLSGKVAIGLALSLILIFVLAHLQFPYFVLLPDWARAAVLIVAVLLFGSGVGRLSEEGWRPFAGFKKRTEEKKRKQRILGHLDSLGPKESEYVEYLVSNNQKSFTCLHSDGTANMLVAKGLLKRGSGSVLDLPHTVPDFVWAELKRRKEESS